MRYCIALLFAFFFLCCSAQTLRSFKYLNYDLNNHYYFGVSLSHSKVRNSGAVRPEQHKISGTFAELNVKRHIYDPGSFRYDLDTKMYTDIVKGVGASIMGNKLYEGEVTSLTTGLLGWHTFAWNTITNSRSVLALGFNHHDYFYFMEDINVADIDRKNPGIIINEPQGYYFSAGPSVMVDYLIGNFLIINLKSTYSIAYWKAANTSKGIRDDSYPLPHFVGTSLEFLSAWGVYMEIDHNRLLNKGNNSNKGNRTDFNLGFKFVIGQDG